MSVCKECLEKLDWEFRGGSWFKCKECWCYYFVTSNIQPKICTLCSDDLKRCEICEWEIKK